MKFLTFLKEQEEKELKADQEEAIDSLEDVNSEDDEKVAKMDLDCDETEEVDELLEGHIKLDDNLTLCGMHPDDEHPKSSMSDHNICPNCDDIAHMMLTGKITAGELKQRHMEAMSESVLKKKGLDILKGRYKHNSRLLILRKMSGDKEGKKKTSPHILALFKLMFEYRPKMGRFGKWMVRKDKKKYLDSHDMTTEIRAIKKKRKKLRILKRRGDIKSKQKRHKKVAGNKTAGKTVDAKGKIA